MALIDDGNKTEVFKRSRVRSKNAISGELNKKFSDSA